MNNPEEKSIPLTRIQKLIGKRMQESNQSKACFRIELKADVTELMGLRPKISKSLGVKITSNAFLIRALALAAQKYPLVVGTLEEEAAEANIRIADTVNVGFAVNTAQGLVMPVIRQAQRKSLAEIARLEKSLTEKARSNKLTLEEIEGETIAFSNLGASAIDSFVAIIPPQVSAVLAVGNTAKMAVPNGDKIRVRRMITLTLSADQRIIDGAYAAEFLNSIKEKLQNPQQLA